MPEIINHFFDGETLVIPAPNGQVKCIDRFHFADERTPGYNITPLAPPAYLTFAIESEPPLTAEAMATTAVVIGTVKATGGTPPYSYAWYMNGVEMTNSSSHTDTLTTDSLKADKSGSVYVCIVNDANGEQIQSSGTTLTIYDALLFKTNPAAAVSGSVGGSATISCVVTGGVPDLTYQWFKNSVAITGATSTTLTLNNLAATDDQSVYYCVATDAQGHVLTSSRSTLTVS